MRALLAALAAALVVIVAAPAAHAATVSVAGDEIVIVGGAEESRLSMAEGRGIEDGSYAYSIYEESNALTAGERCVAVEDRRTVVCTLPEGAPARRIRADLGAGTDIVRQSPGTATPVFFSGGEGADFMAGGAGADRFEGGPGNDFMWGDEGPAGDAVTRAADEFFGGEGTDRVSYTGHRADRIRVTLDGVADDGAPGEGDNVHPDVEDLQGDPGAENALYGTDAPNFLWGGQRNDVIAGGGGADRILGDRGDDTIEARDGVADSIACGEGADRVTVDREDVLEPGCENVDAPPGPGPGPSPGPGPGSGEPSPPPPPLHGTFPVSFPQRSLRPAKDRRIVVRVKCGDLAGCSGSVDVRTVKKVRLGRRWQSFALGLRSFSLSGGQTARLTYRLTKRQMAALRRVRKVRLMVRAVEVRPDQRDWTGSLTLRRRR